jgi:hypothetical protein
MLVAPSRIFFGNRSFHLSCGAIRLSSPEVYSRHAAESLGSPHKIRGHQAREAIGHSLNVGARFVVSLRIGRYISPAWATGARRRVVTLEVSQFLVGFDEFLRVRFHSSVRVRPVRRARPRRSSDPIESLFFLPEKRNVSSQSDDSRSAVVHPSIRARA